MKKTIVFCLILCTSFLRAQSVDSLQTTLYFQEYIALVRQFHPIVKQANLITKIADAGVLKARGEFDPKLEANYDGKEFLGSDYFDILTTSLKIPTWYGIEFKAGFDDTDGSFLNPERFIPDEDGLVPNDGQLFSAGVSLSLGEGFFINKRMATLRKAKIFRTLSQAERTLQVNTILTQASLSYFSWLRSYNELMLYRNFLENAEIRFRGVSSQVIQGDKAAIDSLEAGITVKNRKLGLQQALLNYQKASLELSNFLWNEDSVPLELQNTTIPEESISITVDEVLRINTNLPTDFVLEQHPKIIALRQKIKVLDVDKKLKADKLKPKLDVNYNFLALAGEGVSAFNTRDFKAGFAFKFDIFLRKERGELRQAKFKLRDAELNYKSEFLQLQNKIAANYQELVSFNDQIALIAEVVADYEALLKAEERKFDFGESSVFLINSRERSLLDTQLKQIDLQNKLFKIKVKLFNNLAIDLESIQ